jgi:FixJ family two-component response regulator
VSSNSVPRVFVVADERSIASALAAILKLHGYSAISFTSPLEALAAARSKAPDLLVADFSERAFSGADLADEMTRLSPKCKILLFSGEAISNEGSRAGACSEYQLLKRDYESALREEQLYDCGGAASAQQAIKYKSEAKAASVVAGERFAIHSRCCPVCEPL